MKKRIILPILFTLLSLVVIGSSLVAYAYFSSRVVVYTEDGTTNFKIGMELNTLFDRLNSDTTNAKYTVATGDNLNIVCSDTSIFEQSSDYYDDVTDLGLTKTTVDDTIYYTYNPDATWGSASNPYIISEMRNLQNLYILQNNGFFDYLTKDGIRECHMPYFLVCEPDGTPVKIDCTGQEFEYIGNETYPFIGYVGGAFITTINSETQTTEIDGKTSTQSTIYNLTVNSEDDVVDVGLFGHVGYLGDDSEAVANGEETFVGAVSTISDLLLYDVKVVVKEKSSWEVLADKIGDTINHIFSFTDVSTEKASTTTSSTMPQENHHIGILAGHIEYTSISNISVYYSSDDIAAIDVKLTNTSTDGTSANFKSASGIIGYIYHMNSFQSGGTVSIGGTSNSDVEVSGSGYGGSGGGELSGTGRGYVTASSIYNNYYVSYDNKGSGTRSNVTSSDSIGQEVWKYYKKGSTDVNYGVMVDYNGTTYTLHSHNGISATISGSVLTVNGNCTWTNYIIHDTVNDTYLAEDGKELTSFTMLDLKIYDAISLEDGSTLCTEYIRDRILWGTESTGMYYFYDGVFTFSLSATTDVIEDTWDNDTPDTITLGINDDDKWTTDASGQSNAVVAFVKQATSQNDLSAGKKIFITYKDSSGSYHLITLADNSDYNQGNQNNAVTTPSTELSLVDDETKATLKAALDGGYLTLDSADGESGVLISEADLKSQWDDIQIFDVGGATTDITLDELRQKYQINATWNDEDSDSTTYEDDGTTEATDALKTNSQAIQNNYYMIDSTIDTDYETGSYSYFELGSNSTSISVSDLNTAISSLNSSYYEDDWTTAITSSTSPLQGLSVGSSYSQNEYNFYKDGYFYFTTYDISGTSCYYRYYYVNSSGTATELGTVHKQWNKSWDTRLYSFFNSSSATTDSNGIKCYTKTFTYNSKSVTKTLPLLYEEDGSYYKSYTRDTGDTNFLRGSDQAYFYNNLYFYTYSASYDYIVATITGNGITYTWNGTTTTCTNVSKTSGTIKSEHNLDLGLYYAVNSSNIVSKDYSLYTCTVGSETKTGFMITRYALDGYSLKSQTGTGIKYTLNGSTSLSGKGVLLSTKDYALPSGVKPLNSLTLASNTYDLYIVDNKLVVRIANYAVDGYILANITNTSVTYTLNSTTAQDNVNVFSKDGQGNPLTVNISNGSKTKAYSLYTTRQGSLAILLIINGQSGGTYQFWHSNSSDKDDPYVLRLLRRAYIASYYSVLSATDAYATTASNFTGVTTPTVSNSKDATLTFNNDGSVYISYTLAGHKYYLAYDEDEDYFTTSSTATKLYIFTVEATHDTTISDSIVPVAGTSQGTYSADEYVLYPKTSSDTSATTSDDPVYELKSIYSLGTGWNNSNGQALTKSDLYKRFSLTNEISWDITLNVFNGSWDFGSESLSNDTSIVAPIGSDGTEANIPKGCIAFKINDTDAEGYQIRVIVSIPTSIYYPSETDVNGNSLYDLETDEDYYFALWQTESAGESLIQSFSKDNALEKFELPRSHPYEIGADPSSSDYILVELNGTTYRAYLAGSQILVAYSFTVTEAGVYVLGATNGPMEIVYFSADSTASKGKDGTTSYKMGTIDFVYDDSVDGSTATKIITIDQLDTESDGTVDYSNYYYATLCLLYTDNSNLAEEVLSGDSDVTNGFANINDFAIYIRRTRQSDASIMSISVKGGTQCTGGIADAAYIILSRYAVDSDTVTRSTDSLKE